MHLNAKSAPASEGGTIIKSWFATLGRIGAVTALVFGVGSQAAIAVFGEAGVGPEPTISQRALAVGALVAMYTASCWVLGAITLPLLSRPAGRRMARGFVATVLTIGLVCHMVGVGIRILSGTHFTLPALAYCLSSWQHFAHAGVWGYARYTLPIILTCILFGGAVVRRLRAVNSATEPARRRERELFGQGAGVLGVAAIALLAPLSPYTTRGLLTALPELAFLDSILDAPRQEALDADGEQRVAQALESPPLQAGAIWSARVESAGAPKQNVLVVTLESVSARHVGYQGYRGDDDRDVTPNLDRIASRSLRARRAWTTATHSNYAQMAILSSLFPRRGSTLDMYQRLDYPRTLLHDLAHEAGMQSGTISSQDESWQGMLRFQQTGTETYFLHSPDFGGKHLDTGTELVVPDQVTAGRVVEWTTERRDEPWALYVNLQATHFPYMIPDDAPRPFAPHDVEGTFNYMHYALEERDRVINRYDNALSYVDAQLGLIEQGLRDAGQLDRTVWVITSDHGELFHEHGMVTHGRSLYDAESRVPLLVHYPDGLPPGDVDAPVSHIDILPTVTDLMGIEPHPSFQGSSFLPDQLGSERAAVLLNIQGWKHAQAAVCWPWKLIVNASDGETQLFHLERDPGEETNLMGTDAGGVSAELRRLLTAHMVAQQRYHSTETSYRSRQYAPRMPSCPALPRAEVAAVKKPQSADDQGGVAN